jgi:hypothetical protein
MSGRLDAAGTASDSEGGEKLADRLGAGRTPDFGLPAETDQGFEFGVAGLAAELVERHKAVL